MSRSALWRQEGAKKRREKEADDLFSMAVEEGRNNPSKTLPLWGPDDSFHFNPVLLEKIIKSRYFQKCCRDIKDWNKLVDEVYYNVKDLEPWNIGGQPSDAFCLLLRLLTLRCSEKQMKLLLDHVDSPYIRGIGFLYLRYAGEPSSIWGWIEPYLYDNEPITIAAKLTKNRDHKAKNFESKTIGNFVRRIFSTERDFYGTMLPRLPIQIERDLQVKLLFAETIQARAQKHLSDRKTMAFFKTLGSRVMALYGDDENPITWYEGVVDRVVLRDEASSRQLTVPKFVVTFPEYGNTETVTLGEIEMMGAHLDSINKEKPAREERQEHKRSSWKKEDAERKRNRNFVRGEDKCYGRSDWKSDQRRDFSVEKYHSRDDHSRGIGGTSTAYPVGNSHRHGESKYRRGYHVRKYDDSRDSRSHASDNGDYSTSQLPSSDDLYDEVRRREQANVIATGKQAVSGRPINVNMRAKRHPDRNWVGRHEERRSFHSTQPVIASARAPGGEKRSTEEIVAQGEKRKKLVAKYG